MKKWTLVREGPADKNAFALRVKEIMQQYQCGRLLAALLVHRGYDVDSCGELLDETLIFDDPYELKDMDKAVERINQALDNYEHIVVYGDYDCDGVTASVLLYTYLSTLGADVEIRLPHRQKDGYGLHEAAVKEMAENGVNLIITVDNGISAIEEAKLIGELEMDLIITDHHIPGEQLPPAIAVVNPHRKDCESRFKDLAGVGVALKVVAALEDGDHVAALESFASIAAVGTIGDIMPMRDENRSIVRFGLQMLAHNDMAGLSALLHAAGVREDRVSTRDIAFGVVPRINAAGRIDDAMHAVELLLCEDPQEAEHLAERLTEANTARQQLEHNITDAISLSFAKDPQHTWQRVLVAYGENWHAGVIGICAARLVEQYGKPAFVISIDPASGVCHGSARGFGSFSIYEALHETADYMEAYGGHEGAGGFSLKIENLSKWEQALYAYCAEKFDLMPPFELQADMVVTPRMLTCDAVEELSRLEPYGSKPTGEKNKAPVFVLKNCEIKQIYPLSGGKHLRLSVETSNEMAQILMFGTSMQSFPYTVGDVLDFVVSASVSTYQNQKQLSLKAEDYRSSYIKQDKFFAAKSYYEKLRRKEKIEDHRILLRMGPTRDEIAVVYRALMQKPCWECNLETLYPAIVHPKQINYCKFCLCIDILSELELIRVDRRTGYLYISTEQKKVNLSESKLYAYFVMLAKRFHAAE